VLLSEWRKSAPNRESLSTKILAVLEPVLADLGADGDPSCWVLWGEDPEIRYSVMAPTPAGLITVVVRVGGSGEGPRATGKLVRWGKLQVSELAVESADGHRLVAVQVEGQVLKGMDAEADSICEFVRGLLAGIDGRAYAVGGAIVEASVPRVAAAKPAAIKAAAVKAAAAKAATAKLAPAKPAPVKPAVKPAPARPEAKSAPVKPAAHKDPAKPGLKSLPAPVASTPGDARDAAGARAGAPAAANQPRARKPARTPGGKTQPAWVAPHPIGLPVPQIAAGPTVVPSAPHQPGSKSVAPKPAAAPAGHPAAASRSGEPAEGGPVWDVPDPSESLTRETKRPRTWTP
jgi:hypothetical protein